MNKNTTLRKVFLLLLIIIAAILFARNSYASHGMGGEITWKCLPGGQFVFEMKFYRDCNGTVNPTSLTLATNVTGQTQIPLSLVAVNDISPDGFISNGTTLCLICSQGSATTPVPGLVEEFVYRSAPITLPGVPPATGWVFQWGLCCRSATLTNITGGGSLGFMYRAIMYPYQATANNPCFDSSPYFAERPSIITCTGYPYKFNYNAIDPEQDSLVYSWAYPITDFGNAIPFAPGYFINSQLPSTAQDSANVAPVLNPATGEVSFTSFTGGYFATAIKVRAYKCGIIVAEITREINVVLNNNCPPVSGGAINSAPIMSAPFNDPNTGLQTSYVDTVTAGDTVNFQLSFTDFDLFNNGTGQVITLEGSGSQFGINYSNPDSGCANPPCATLTSSLPTSFNIAGYLGFNWETTCDHVTGNNPQCANLETTYNFVIRAHDNYCPANATTLATISITVVGVRPTVSASGPPAICLGDTVILTASGAQSYTWNTGQNGNTLVVTHAGTYAVTGITPGVCMGTTEIIIPPGTIPNVIASAPLTTLCINWPSVVMTGTPTGGSWSGPGIFGNIFNPSVAGAGLHDVIYLVIDSMGCVGRDTIKMAVNLCTGLEDEEKEPGVFVYPNPAVDQITLLLTDKQSLATTIELYNVYGQKVMDVFDGKIEQKTWERKIDVSYLPKGIYILKVNGSNLEQTILIR